MAIIHVLKPHIANQIAAGEVIERPASVVKELVENSLDAGATAITVRIENGGMRSITVVDNGCGIARDDCKNAFLRHATSKIETAASVACVTMTTRQKDAEVGTKLLIDNGTVLSEEDVSCVFGTTFTVEELFASVPARLKFLKSARTEAGYIGDYLGKMILARPEVSFRYESDGKTVYETYGDGDLYNAIFCVYGKTVADKLVPVSYDTGYMKITGYLGLPEISRNNRASQILFINGRSIRSNAVSSAVAKAYDTRLMIGRFPFFVLNLFLAPQEVDVNVHPTKAEVRFADENRVFNCVSAAAKLALTDTEQYIEHALDNIMPKQPVTEPTERIEAPVQQRPRIDFHEISNKNRAAYSYRESNYNMFRPSGSVGSVPSFRIETETRQTPQPKQTAEPLFIDESFEIIGCAFLTYWIVTRGEQMFLIDQHAAHERKLYEALAAQTVQQSSQELLVAREVTLTPTETELFESHQSELIELGFGLVRSGALTVLMSAVPVLNGKLLSEAYLHSVLAIFEEQGKNPQKALLKERLMQTACKHAIKGGEPVTREEIQELLQEFLSGTLPLTCPHGRPVVVQITKTELEKMFRRIV